MSDYIFKKQYYQDNPFFIEDTTVTPHTFNDVIDFTNQDDPYPCFYFKVYNDKSYMVFFTWHDENQNKDYAEPIYYIQRGEQNNQIELKQLNPSFFDDVSVFEAGDNYTEFDVGAYFRYTTISDKGSSTDQIKLVALEWEPIFELGSAIDSLTGYYKFFVTTNINYLSKKDYYNEINTVSGYKALNILKIKSLANLDKMSWFATNYGVIENTDYTPGDEIVAFTDNNSSNSYNYYITLPNSQHNEVCLKEEWQGERYILEGCSVSSYSTLKNIIYNNSKKNGITEAQAGTFLDDNVLSTDNTIIPIGIDLIINSNGATKLDYKTIYDFIDTYNNNWSNLQVSQSKPIKLDDYYDGGYYILQKGIVSDMIELVKLVKNSSDNITMIKANNYIKLYCEDQNLNTKKIVSNMPLICNSSLVSQKLNKSNFDLFKTAYKAYWSLIGANQKFPIKDIPSTLVNDCLAFFSFNTNDLIDQTENGHDTYALAASGSSIGTGKVGKGLTTTSVNNTYGAKGDPFFTSESVWSVSFWGKNTTHTTYNTGIGKDYYSPIISIRPGTSPSGQIGLRSKTYASTTYIMTNSGLTRTEYNHIVITVNDNVAKGYFNGVLEKTVTFNETIGQLGIKYLLGNDADGNNSLYAPYGACIDEVGIWDRVLTDNEVAELYRAGNDGVSYPFQSYSPIQS